MSDRKTPPTTPSSANLGLVAKRPADDWLVKSVGWFFQFLASASQHLVRLIMGGYNSKPFPDGALLAPAMEGDLDKVKEMVGTYLGACPPQNVCSGRCNAVNSCSAETSRSLLQAFVDSADPKQGGNNAMHGAVFGGHVDIVKYLAESCHASLTIQNDLGCDPLWLAAGYNRTEILEYLLTKLPNPKESLMQTNKTGDTPMIAAASRGNKHAILILLEVSKALRVRDKLMAHPNRSMDTALAVAIAAGHASGKTLNLLLDNTPVESIDAPNKKGLTPLLIAAERDDVPLAKALLKKGASGVVCDASSGTSPLAIAAFCGSKRVLEEVFLKDDVLTGTLINRPNDSGCTPLWLATRAGRADVVQLLLSAGAKPFLEDNEGKTPLDIAEQFDRNEIAPLLKAADVPMDIVISA